VICRYSDATKLRFLASPSINSRFFAGPLWDKRRNKLTATVLFIRSLAHLLMVILWNARAESVSMLCPHVHRYAQHVFEWGKVERGPF